MNRLILTFFLVLFLCPVFVLAEQIDINSATLSQLDELTGIGPVYAQSITDGRPYSSVDDLLRVKGIGPATLQKIKDQGLACVNCQTQLQQTTPTPVPNNDGSAVTAATTETTTTEPTTAINEPIKTIPAIIYPPGIFINEILPNPQGADETDEWIELYNSNNYDVDLSGWQLQDRVGTITTYTINPSASSGQTKILAGGFLIFKRPDTKIMLNNDQDGLNLLTPDGKIIDSVAFISAPLGQSYNKATSDWQWSTTLTPGAQNIITAAQTNVPAKTATKSLSKTKNSVKNNDTADISQSLNINQEVSEGNKTANPWFLFFMVLIMTVILAAIVLLIKLKFSKKQHVRT